MCAIPGRSWTWITIVATGPYADLAAVRFHRIAPCIRLSSSPLQPSSPSGWEEVCRTVYVPSKEVARHHTDPLAGLVRTQYGSTPAHDVLARRYMILAIVRPKFLEAKKPKKPKDDHPSLSWCDISCR